MTREEKRIYDRQWRLKQSPEDRARRLARKRELRPKHEGPWTTHYKNAHRRCRDPKEAYFKKGIKFMLTHAQVKFLYIRDNAHLLKEPSLDRIISSQGYKLSNCRFIECDVNRMQGNITRWGNDR